MFEPQNKNKITGVVSVVVLQAVLALKKNNYSVDNTSLQRLDLVQFMQ